MGLWVSRLTSRPLRSAQSSTALISCLAYPPALTGGAHRQIDDVQAVFVQLVGPAAVEVVSAAQEVEEGFQRRVVLNQKGVGLEGAVQLLGKILEGIVRLGLIRDDDDAVQISLTA